ncbi:MAG: DUF3025 domain-containing protein [Betaproteobacteria bacterium]|nr:DUF3025 domain-containing protein [Betaproteobacteria bacterium]
MKHPAFATPFFDAVRAELDALAEHSGSNDRDALNALAAGRSASVRFVAPSIDISAVKYEMTIAATGDIPTRDNAHDFFNALQWLAFPQTKGAINAGHLRHAGGAGVRPVARDVLTMIDESGVIVASADEALLTLLREFKWRELFVERRADVIARMRFALIGHGLMEKALAPFIGLTGKAILLNIADDQSLDAAAARWIADDSHLASSRMLSPLPLLGIPGWDERNENSAFYDNTGYFRTGRRDRTSKSA